MSTEVVKANSDLITNDVEMSIGNDVQDLTFAVIDLNTTEASGVKFVFSSPFILDDVSNDVLAPCNCLVNSGHGETNLFHNARDGLEHI